MSYKTLETIALTALFFSIYLGFIVWHLSDEIERIRNVKR